MGRLHDWQCTQPALVWPERSLLLPVLLSFNLMLLLLLLLLLSDPFNMASQGLTALVESGVSDGWMVPPVSQPSVKKAA